MTSKLIVYQLKNYDEDYPRIREEIKKHSKWAKPMDRVWIIKTDKKASEIRDALKKATKYGGSIFVIDITGSGWASSSIPTKVATWLKENL